jgi:hypothetical protein
LKWSVREAQAKAISSTSLEDTVRLILHLKAQDLFDNPLESFFLILIRRLLGAMSTFHFEPKFLTKFRNQKNALNTFKDFGAILNSVASKENK